MAYNFFINHLFTLQFFAEVIGALKTVCYGMLCYAMLWYGAVQFSSAVEPRLLHEGGDGQVRCKLLEGDRILVPGTHERGTGSIYLTHNNAY